MHLLLRLAGCSLLLLLLHSKLLWARASLIHVAVHTSKGTSCTHMVVHGRVATHGGHLGRMHGRLLWWLLELSHVVGLRQGRGLRLRRRPHLTLLVAVRGSLLAHRSHGHGRRGLVHLRRGKLLVHGADGRLHGVLLVRLVELRGHHVSGCLLMAHH